ncbi:MAG: segregation/condensation protein A [Chloroflexi bacterium]|nr:segregation/condensation protein A [Chloroflexota bacterium]
MPVFEGPLDLLLHLIEKEELDITRVALAQVTDQYLAYIAGLEGHPVRELADFLAVAAKLLLIKSAALLPRAPTPEPEPEDVGDELVEQLKIYKRFRQIADLLNERQQQGMRSYIRIATVPRPAPQLDLGDISMSDLLTVALEVLEGSPTSSADDVVKPTATIEEQITRIDGILSRRPRTTFRDVLLNTRDRVEIIVTLLAVLEMIKLDRIIVRQERLFGEIVIERQAHAAPPHADVTSTTAAA